MKRNINVLLFVFLLLTTAGNAEFLYTLQDLGTLASEKSEARSLNEQGEIVGKYFNKGQAADFLWTPESGFLSIADETEKEVFPMINNEGKVLGYIEKPGSWFTAAETRLYSFTKEAGISLKMWTKRENGKSIVPMNQTYTIFCFHTDVFKAKFKYAEGNGKIVTFSNESDLVLSGDQYPVALNDSSQVLFTEVHPGLYGSSLFAMYSLNLYDFYHYF